MTPDAPFRQITQSTRPRHLWRTRCLSRIKAYLACLLTDENRLTQRLSTLLENRRDAPPFTLSTQAVTQTLKDGLRLRIAPTQLHRCLSDWIWANRQPVLTCNHFIGRGDWQPISYPIENNSIVKEARELVAVDFRYQETNAFQRYHQRLTEGRPLLRNNIPLNSPARIDAYFERFLWLFDSIREHGLLPLRELGADSRRAQNLSLVRSLCQEYKERDIGVAVDADGRLLKLISGQHRFAIALTLNLPTIPVQCRLVHLDWLNAVVAQSKKPVLDALRDAVVAFEIDT